MNSSVVKSGLQLLHWHLNNLKSTKKNLRQTSERGFPKIFQRNDKVKAYYESMLYQNEHPPMMEGEGDEKIQ